jgi:hypothetical protein
MPHQAMPDRVGHAADAPRIRWRLGGAARGGLVAYPGMGSGFRVTHRGVPRLASFVVARRLGLGRRET